MDWNNKEDVRLYKKIWMRNNRWKYKEQEKIYARQYNPSYYQKNKVKIKKNVKYYYIKFREEKKIYNKYYRQNNKERIRMLMKKWRITPTAKLSHTISCYIQRSLKDKKNGKHWETIVGYSLSDLITHLKSKFKTGMNLDNYGAWQIDHIIPISFFKYSSYEDESFKQCWDLNNLQPLWKEDNIRKGNRYSEPTLR